jgi:hypothetical protein
MQKMTPNPDGTMPYKGPIDCAMKTLKNEGPLTFYTGFPTYLIRWVAAADYQLRKGKRHVSLMKQLRSVA